MVAKNYRDTVFQESASISLVFFKVICEYNSTVSLQSNYALLKMANLTFDILII